MSKRVATSLIATVALLYAGAASAEPHCSSAADQSAFEVGALKSELSVLAVGCSDEDLYNSFVERYRSELLREDSVVNAWFKHTYGKTAQKQYDSYITLLANEQGQIGMREGSDFCPRDKLMFNEVMALRGSTELPQYAAGKDLVPPEMGSCNVERAAAAPAEHGKRRAPAKRRSEKRA